MWDSRLADLLARRIYFGTSSWKYEGWRSFFYRRSYRNDKDFNEHSLSEYAENFPAVGVDHTFYAWPNAKTFEKYFAQTPESFRFALKATERVSIFQYPSIRRYGKEAGQRNPDFLDAGVFREKFLEALRPFRSRLGPVMLEFSQFRKGTVSSGSEFVERLDRFFSDLADETDFQFAVEIRNANWMRPAYFDMLTRHHVGHVFNSWTRMPSLLDQLTLTEGCSFPVLVSRILLQPGTAYDEAVEAFAPYNELHLHYPDMREGAARLVERALEQKIPAFIFVNNRAEGCAPRTIEGILDRLSESALDQKSPERGLNPSSRSFSAASR